MLAGGQGKCGGVGMFLGEGGELNISDPKGGLIFFHALLANMLKI